MTIGMEASGIRDSIPETNEKEYIYNLLSEIVEYNISQRRIEKKWELADIREKLWQCYPSL